MHRMLSFNALALAMGCAYQSSDVYASFGVNNAVFSSSDQGEHEQNMLALNADVRDGDDAINIEGDQEPTDGEQETAEEDQEDEQQEEQEEQQEEGDEDTDGDDQSGDLQPLPEPPKELQAASDELTQYAEGLASLREQAIKAGLPEAVADRIEQEYADGGISEASMKALEKAGYSANFVNSYVKGQEAVAEQFVQSVVQYAGGQDKFQTIIKHMEATSPDSVESLYEAMERQDLATIRTIINLGIASRTKQFGKAPEKIIQRKAPATNPAPRKSGAQPFSSTAEMVKEMSKPEYRNDPAFRAKIEARVAASSF